MPYYEYICRDCGKPARLFFSFAEYETAQPACPHCAGQHLKRHIRRVAIAKSEDARMDSLLDDSALANLDEDDPKALGQFMRKMSQEMGEDMGDEFNEVVDRLEHGESPEAIEESLPDLGAGGDDFLV
ncbi:MAG: zinc ribbon domain-containing protein [Chloroflexi bacterium]|nr:zinc ribbon domain-containing protein [Chloroflexota bacterium]